MKFKTLNSAPSLEKVVKNGARKVLVLDFDGVFNALSLNPPKKAFYTPSERVRYPNPHYDPSSSNRERREPKSYLLAYSSELVSDFNKVLANDDVYVVWLSTWKENMGGICKTLGLKSANEMFYLPWEYYIDLDTVETGKTKALSNFTKNIRSLNVRVVWAEDLDLLDDTLLLPSFSHFTKDNFLPLFSNSDHGLSREQVEQLSVF